jgi:putative transposase
VVKLARENSAWGYDRIVGAMANLGHPISDQTVGNILRRHGIPPAPERKRNTAWKDFIATHMSVLAGTDFLTAEVITWRGLVTYYVLFFLHLDSRRVSIAGNVILFPATDQAGHGRDGYVRCRERLGGMLKHYHREAA